ncbi:glycosyltransferase family 25 protein [Pseudoalteromonas nigrifaciens]|uniref:glycosyltransferase family 25 protein n=1 Tax=Pseudoalteromonas nigrifaciens TaxID=28109 RepID=UPI0030CA171A
MTVPIYIINMPDCDPRWHATTSQLELVGLTAQRFPATVGKQLSNEQRDAWYCSTKNKKNYHRDLTMGEIGCYVSHMRVWEKMVEENTSLAVILEDDLFIKKHLKTVISAAQQLQNWDLVKLSDNRNFPFFETSPLAYNLTLGNYKKAPNGTQGYILSLDGAKKLLQRKPFYRPVDVDMQFHSEVGLIMVGIKPYPIAEDRSFESEITRASAGQHSNRSTFFRNFKYRTRIHFERKKITANLSSLV